MYIGSPLDLPVSVISPHRLSDPAILLPPLLPPLLTPSSLSLSYLLVQHMQRVCVEDGPPLPLVQHLRGLQEPRTLHPLPRMALDHVHILPVHVPAASSTRYDLRGMQLHAFLYSMYWLSSFLRPFNVYA